LVIGNEEEKLVNLDGYNIIKGYLIFYTNDEKYGEPKKEPTGLFKEFSLQKPKDKKEINIKPNYEYKYGIEYTKENINKNPSIKGKPPIKFEKAHNGIWDEYEIDMTNTKNCKMYKLVFEITKNK